MSTLTYELLAFRKAPDEIAHDSVGGAIVRSLRESAAILIDGTSFIPPWFTMRTCGLLRIGWGSLDPHFDGCHFVVERLVTDSGLFSVREVFLDGGGYPVKSQANQLETGLTLFAALRMRDEMACQLGSQHFVDVVPQELCE